MECPINADNFVRIAFYEGYVFTGNYIPKCFKIYGFGSTYAHVCTDEKRFGMQESTLPSLGAIFMFEMFNLCIKFEVDGPQIKKFM